MAKFLKLLIYYNELIMKKILLFFVLFMAVSFAVGSVYAQNLSSTYKTAVGAKAYFGNGSVAGINAKHFMNNSTALEGSLLFKNGFVGLEGIYQWHGKINGANGLKWYVGPGAWLGFYNNKSKFDNNNSVLFALKGNLGLDYKFSGAPINVAFDVNPTFSLSPVSDFSFLAGFAFRFAF